MASVVICSQRCGLSTTREIFCFDSSDFEDSSVCQIRLSDA